MNKILIRGIAIAAACFTFFGTVGSAIAFDTFAEAEDAGVYDPGEDADVFADAEYTTANKDLYSYLFYNDGQYTTVDRYTERGFNWDIGKWETLGYHTLVTKFDSDMKTVLSRRELPEELPVWGGVAASEDGEYYFVVTGQNNTKESKDVECVRVTKYDKNWGRLGSVGLYDCNTTKPFHYGRCSIAMNGDLMLVHTSHEMYKTKDGYNHQANMSVWVDTSEMKIIGSSTKVSNVDDSYVSHSFYQYAQFDDDGNVILVNHGDAYPRAAIIHASKNAVNGTDESNLPKYGEWYHADAMTFRGDTGFNETKAATGGLAVGNGRYLIAISSVKQDENWSDHKTKSIYVVSANADLSEVRNNDKPLVEYAEGEDTAGTPQIVKVSDELFIVMWERGEKLYTVPVDKNGEKVGEVTESEGSLDSEITTKLSCQPVMCGDVIRWYTMTLEGDTVWYSFDPSDLSAGIGSEVVDVPEDEVKEDVAEITLDANGGMVSPAVVLRVPGETIGSLPVPSFSGHVFDGWYTAKEGGEAVTADTVVSSKESVTLYARWKDGAVDINSPWGGVLPADRVGYADPGSVPSGLWVAGIDSKGYTYTGYAITPEPRVYYGNTRLYEYSDYTIKYKNNTKVGDNKAQVKITGKGEYAGKLTEKFSINKVQMDSSDITAYEMADLYTGSQLKPAPYVFWKGKQLKKNKDYTVSYVGGFTEPATYVIKITGKGRFSGTKEIPYTIVGEGSPVLPMNSATAKMTRKPSTPSNEETCREMLSVTMNGATLTKGFNVKWENTYGYGSASAILIGNGEVADDGVTKFVGSKRVKFNIKSLWVMCPGMITKPGDAIYTGLRQTPTVTISNGNESVKSTLKEGRDYVVTFKKNVNAGKATMTVKGINGYSGTVKVNFTIKPVELTQDMLVIGSSSMSGPDGAREAVKVVVNGRVLAQDRDYIIDCQDNTFTVRGKGNFTGELTGSFSAAAAGTD